MDMVMGLSSVDGNGARTQKLLGDLKEKSKKGKTRYVSRNANHIRDKQEQTDNDLKSPQAPPLLYPSSAAAEENELEEAKQESIRCFGNTRKAAQNNVAGNFDSFCFSARPLF